MIHLSCGTLLKFSVIKLCSFSVKETETTVQGNRISNTELAFSSLRVTFIVFSTV